MVFTSCGYLLFTRFASCTSNTGNTNPHSGLLPRNQALSVDCNCYEQAEILNDFIKSSHMD